MMGCFEENILLILSKCYFTIPSILWLSWSPQEKFSIHYLKTCRCFFSPHHSKFIIENYLTIQMLNIIKMDWGSRSSTPCRWACSSTLDKLNNPLKSWVHYFSVTAKNVINKSMLSSTLQQTQCILVLWNDKCWFYEHKWSTTKGDKYWRTWILHSFSKNFNWIQQENSANNNHMSQLVTGPHSLNESTSGRDKWSKLRFIYLLFMGSWISILGIMTRLWAAEPRNCNSRAGRSKHPDQLCDLPSILLNGYQELASGRGVKLTTYIYLVPVLRMSAAVTSLPHMTSWHAQALYLFLVYVLMLLVAQMI